MLAWYLGTLFRRPVHGFVCALFALFSSACASREAVPGSAAKAKPGYRQLTANAGENCCASLSRDASTVVYASDRASLGNFDIWIQSSESAQARRLTDDPARDTDPAITPDKQWVYFSSLREPAGIYRIPAKGGTAELVLEEATSPRLSPAGSRLAAFLGGAVVLDLETGKAHRLAPDFPESLSPIWSPDGTHVLFTGRKSMEDASDCFTVPATGGDPATTGLIAHLKKQGFSEVYAQAWLPGDWIIFAGKQGQEMTLWKVQLTDPGPPQRATDSPSGDFRASFASGKLIFDRWHVGLDLWSLPADVNSGRALAQPQRLTSGGTLKGSPAISQDGKWLAYHADTGQQAFRLTLMDLESKQAKLDGPSENTFYTAMNGEIYLYGTGPKSALTLFSRRISRWRWPWRSKVCDQCGMPRGITPDGTTALLWFDRDMGNRIESLHLKTGQRTVLVQDAGVELFGPELSPDGLWMTFVARTGPTFATYIVPANAPTPRAKWRRVTEPGEYQMAFWAPNGELLYLLTQHGETNLNWLEALKLNAATKDPVGAPFTVYRFEGHRGPTKDPVWNRPAAAEGRIVMLLGESAQDIWMLDIDNRPVQPQ